MQADTLSDVLETVRLTGAIFFLVDARTPWVAEAPASTDLVPAILPAAQHVVSYHVVSEGACWCESPGLSPMRPPNSRSTYWMYMRFVIAGVFVSERRRPCWA